MVAEDFGYCMPGNVDEVHFAYGTPCPIAVPLGTMSSIPCPSPSTGKGKVHLTSKIGNGNLEKGRATASETANPSRLSVETVPAPRQHLGKVEKLPATRPISPWHSVPLARVDPILHSQTLLRRDNSGLAVDLSVGAYRDADGQPTELRCITRAASRLAQKPRSHAYLPLAGHAGLRAQSVSLVFGTSISAQSVAVVQTVSGSGALRLALELCRKRLGATVALISDPSWPNHAAMAAECGMIVAQYAYYDRAKRCVRIQDMLDDLRAASRGSVVILHACAHNPTGADLTREEWVMVGDVVEDRGLLPLFDLAYQGLASGDVDEDAHAIRMFVRRGIAVLVASSMSKSMGLYNSRVGTLQVALPDDAATAVEATMSQLVWLARATNSSPPAHGAEMAAMVLADDMLRAMWMTELREMMLRTRCMRRALREELEEADGGDWGFVERGCGMFVVLGMTDAEVDEIRDRWHVYLAPEGRLNVCGLTERTVRRVAQGIVSVLGARGGTR